MSQERSIPGPSLMSELSQPGSGCSPQPQFIRRMGAGSEATCVCCGCGDGLLMLSGYPKLLQQPTEHAGRVEPLLGQHARRPRVPIVVGDDPLDAFDRFLDRREAEQPLADRMVAAEAGV